MWGNENNLTSLGLDEVKLRQAKPDDLESMQHLFVDTISAICTKDYAIEQIKVWTSSIKNTQRWSDIIENQYCLLAEIDSTLVGFGSLENASHIDMLYVHKDFQRKGLADKLYTNLEEEAIRRNISSLTSEVSKTAKPFFEKKGFLLIAEQLKILDGVEILNFKMIKEM